MFDEAGNYIDEAAGTVREEAAKVRSVGFWQWAKEPVVMPRWQLGLIAVALLWFSAANFSNLGD